MSFIPTSRLESLLNHHVQSSSAAEELLASLNGRSLAVEVDGLGLELRLEATEGRLRVHDDGIDDATATISGSPLTLLSLLRSSTAGGFRASGSRLRGDAETAEAFSEVLRLARPELEEELSHFAGDVLAHEIAGGARRLTAWGDRALSALRMNSAEFLQEESRQLPARLEAEAFFREVESLREDFDRVAYRVDRLLEKRNG